MNAKKAWAVVALPSVVAVGLLLTSTDVSRGTTEQLVTEAWVARYDGPGSGGDSVSAMAVDAAGNVYVTGTSGGAGTGTDYATVKYDTNGVQQWVARYDGPASYRDEARALAVDDLGNVYVTGQARGVGPDEDYATVKYDTNGVQQWVARYHAPVSGGDRANALTVDGVGNVYVTGRSYGGGATKSDYATVKYDTNGVQQWVARYDGPISEYDEATALAVDGEGNVYVTGTSKVGLAPDDWGYSSDYLTVKYDAQGVQLWAAMDGNSSWWDWPVGLALDGLGSVYVTGTSRNWMSMVGDDYLTVKYDVGGTREREYVYESFWEDDRAADLALDDSGNVYVTGLCGLGWDYGTVKYSAAGGEQWRARYTGPGGSSWDAYDEALALAVDGAGNVYVTGYSGGAGTGSDYATVKYDTNGVQQWVARYDGPAGENDGARAIGVDGLGNVYVAGSSSSDGNTDYVTIKYVQGEVPPPPRRIVMFINGIGGSGDCDIDGWDWTRQALKSQTDMTDSDFMRYVYSSDGEAIPDCAANPGSSYNNIDTCWSLDNSPQDVPTETLLGQAERLAWLLENYLSRPENSDVEISIVAHSQGGVLAAYMIREFAPQDDFQNLSRVKTLVTLDSPLRGFGGIAAKSLKAHHGCGALGLSYDSAYDMTKGWTGHVIERIEAPGRPATTLFTVHEMGLDQVGPVELDEVNDWESSVHWESDHLEVLTGDHNTVWNGALERDPTDTAILRRFITCAVTGIRPPGHCQAYAESLLPPLTVSPDQSVWEVYDAPDGASTIDVLVEWPGSTVTTTLVSPSGRVIDASTSDPDVDHRSGDTFEGFQITDPEPGEWTIEVFGADVPPEGEEVYLSFSAVPDPSVDADADLVWDDEDNCPVVPNGSQADADGDGLGDACDDDNDNDGVLNGDDNCEFVPNADQEDVNGNGIGDACDPDLNDLDEDGVMDGVDNCPLEPNGDQADFDFDGLGDVCDDSDEDGCMDAEELGPDPTLGGQRDPLNPWDFYDVPAPTLFGGGTMNNRDSAVTILNDVLGVLEYTGTSPTFPCNAGPDGIPGNGDDRCYTGDKDGDSVDDGVAYDRSPGPVWSEAPNGAITILEDVLLVLAQTPHSCQTPP